MKCVYCNSDQSRVVDKRGVIGSGEIRRRRECLKCHRRFTTYERAVIEELMVMKRDGRRECFSPEKLLSGIVRATQKRDSATEANRIAEKIERKLRAKNSREVTSKAIGKSVLTELKKIDKVAYLRFASV